MLKFSADEADMLVHSKPELLAALSAAYDFPSGQPVRIMLKHSTGCTRYLIRGRAGPSTDPVTEQQKLSALRRTHARYFR